MVFHSVLFLLWFLPLALLVYYAAPAKCKNLVFLLESILFYAWMNAGFLPLIAVLILLHYAAALCQNMAPVPWMRRLICTVAVAAAVLILVYWKGFFAGLYRLEILPLGISYYTFKLISYQLDVYWGRTEAETNLIDFSMYVFWFPQLLVGPIMRYGDARELIRRPQGRCTPGKFARGAELFVLGLAQKVILADGIGGLWTEVCGTIGLAQASTPLVWLGVAAYSLQLYFDFAGFSNMSNGLSALFGFEGKTNFKFPYMSRSVTEFWTRWHISLSELFRDYVYIPLGGNRRGKRRQVLNLFVVWVLTGLWHSSGGQVNFILWGMYYFVVLLVEKRILKPYLERGRLWPHLYTVLVAVVGWAIFACTSEAVTVTLLFSRLFGLKDGVSAGYYLRNYGVLLLTGVLCATTLPEKLCERAERTAFLPPLLWGALFVICISYVVSGTASTALYAGF